jgi:hypothetical protein
MRGLMDVFQLAVEEPNSRSFGLGAPAPDRAIAVSLTWTATSSLQYYHSLLSVTFLAIPQPYPPVSLSTNKPRAIGPPTP